MGKIARLPDDLANQIAAGEVVERPASVVKELVENALDAGATRVTVAIDVGGLARIRVTDDGEGMTAADAALSLERHATSKIRKIEDLSALGTFGFRGEALPSIGSVARLTMTTRARGADEGTEIVVEGGGAARVRPAGCAVGTTVDVAELFFNVPARRKFLKATATESAHVGEAVLLAALARPDVTFVLIRDGRIAREYLRVAGRAERAKQAHDAERLEACRGARGEVRVEAFLASPERARAGAVALHLFVNGRPVRDRQLARAVAQAYGSVLEPGRYPVGVVYVEMPPALVDVNVHPQKAEVRFADARATHDAVTRELHAALARAFAIPALGPPSRAGSWPPRPGGQWASGVGAAGGWSPSGGVGAWPLREGAPMHGAHDGAERAAKAGAEAGGAPEADPWGLGGGTIAGEIGSGVAPVLPDLFAGVRFYASLKFLAQIRATYLVCEGEDGLYVLDQHAAAERVTFDELKRAHASRDVASQRLLVPEVVALSPAEVAALAEREADVVALGMDVRPVGEAAVAVHAVPTLLSRAPTERLVRDLVAEMTRAAGRPWSNTADLVLATMACHASIRAGDVISADEARALLRALDGVDFGGHCPHGRPVVTRLGWGELERRVGR